MITIADLMRLPPCAERNKLIEAERRQVRAGYRRARTVERARKLEATSVTEATRAAAERELSLLPTESRALIEQRRADLLREVHGAWGKKVPMEMKEAS